MMNFIKFQRGSVTVYVLYAMIFLISTLTIMYASANNKMVQQLSITEEIKGIYEKELNAYESSNI